jgi:hypothetical protein
MEIPKPSVSEIEKYLSRWNSSEDLALPENSLKKLFTQVYPTNDRIQDVLIKVCALNSLYSTHVFYPFQVAKHITGLDVDKKLSEENLGLVNEIAAITLPDGKKRNYYSFATKYCSHHNHLVYPIYDSYVERMILYFKEKDAFYKFGNSALRNYPEYRNILIKFSDFYGLNKFDLKKIDKYLWQAGKEHFPKKY